MKDRVIRRVVSVILILSLLVPITLVSSGVAQAASPNISVGDRVAVTYGGGGVAVRSCASTSCDPPYNRMTAGYEGEVIGGPQYNQGYRWWYIRWVTGHTGWTADASLGGVPYLQPLPGKGIYPNVRHDGLSYRVRVYADAGNLAVRSGPGTWYDPPLTRKSPGSAGWTLADNPVVTQEMVWWRIEWDCGTVGWSADSQAPYGVYLVKEGAKSLPTVGQVSVATYSATDVGQTQATLRGAITNFNNNPSAEIRFRYRVQGTTTWSYTPWVTRTTTATYSRTATGLSPGATYDFQAEGRGSVDTTIRRGDILPFVTDEPAPVGARIDSYSPSTKITVEAGTSFQLKVWFTNTGEADYFYPAVSIWDSAPGTPGREEVFSSYGARTYLSKNAQTSHTWTASLSEAGEYWLQFGVWNDAKSQLLAVAPSLSQNLIAVTEPAERYRLNVAFNPPDGGGVDFSPPSDADGKYAKGTTVTITANPSPGYDFDRWLNTNDNSINPTTVTMNADKTVMLYFAEQRPDLAVSIVSVGSLAIGERASVTIRIANTGNAPIPVKQHTVSVSLIDYEGIDPSSFRAGDSYWAIKEGVNAGGVYEGPVDLPELRPGDSTTTEIKFWVPQLSFEPSFPAIWADTMQVSVWPRYPDLYDDANPSNNVVEQRITVYPSLDDAVSCAILIALPFLVKYFGVKEGIKLNSYARVFFDVYSFCKHVIQDRPAEAAWDLLGVGIKMADILVTNRVTFAADLLKGLWDGAKSCSYLGTVLYQFVVHCRKAGIDIWFSWVKCPVDVLIVDAQGNRTGYWDEVIYEEIEDSAVIVVDDEKLLLVPQTGSYTVMFKGTDVGTMDFLMVLPGDENTARIVEYHDVPIGPHTEATIDVSPDNPGYSMMVDYDGDGQVDEVRYPDLINHSPYEPADSSPADGVTGVPIDTRLSWTGGDPDTGDVVIYDVYLGASNQPGAFVSINQTATTYDPGVLAYGTTYYWRITAFDNHGASAVSPLWSFTTRGYRLTTSSTVGGSVTSPGEDTYGYDIGDTVNLVAEPHEGYQFVNWTGGVHTIADVNSAETTIVMNDHYSVTASFAEHEYGEYSPMVAAGWSHTVGLKSDGTVLAVGWNGYGECNVEDWTNTVQVAAGYQHTVGVKSDGTVVATGYNYYGQCDVGDWTDIVEVAAGSSHTVGLRSDGTVVATNSHDVSGWTDIVQVAAGGYHTIGLKSDGTVVAVGWNGYGQCDVGSWTGIVQVAGSSSHTVGLKSDGTVVAVGSIDDGECDVGGWTDILQVAAGSGHTVGLEASGTVIAVGRSDFGQCDVDDWTDVVHVATGWFFTVGLKSDGTVGATGYEYYGKCNVGGWTDIVQVAAGYEHTVGLRSHGTAVAVGRNNYGQCDVDDWTGIVQVAAGGGHTAGLKSDGTVVAVGGNWSGQLDVGDWTDIIEVAAGSPMEGGYTAALTANGTVVVVGSLYWSGELDSGEWMDITQVAAGGSHILGLKSDATVIASGDNDYGQCDVDDWTNIVQLAAGHYHTVGLRSDGSVVAVGWNGYGQCDVGDWTDITQVTAGWYHTVGLKSDGTVVAVGSNGYWQCEVGDWTGIVQVAAGTEHTVGVKPDGTVVAAGLEVELAKWNLGDTAPPMMAEIYDWYDLDAIRANLSGIYVLMNDLDSTTPGYEELAGPTANEGKGWQPIASVVVDPWTQDCTAVHPFAGVFDGQGHEIRGLYIYRPGEDGVGIFGAVDEGAIIKNVRVVGVDVTGGWVVGGLVGANSGTLDDSDSSGAVSGDRRVGGSIGVNSGIVTSSSSSSIAASGDEVGGLVGWNLGTIRNSYATGDVTGGKYVGGLVGWSTGTVTNCYASGTVNGLDLAGGLVGSNYDTLNNSYSTGSVSGREEVGGLTGENRGIVRNCYSAGTVRGEVAAGGLVGSSSGTVSDSFWDIETSGQSISAGGTGKSTAEMMNIATFTDTATKGLDDPWDMTALASGETNPAHIWNIVDRQTYPFLSWQQLPEPRTWYVDDDLVDYPDADFTTIQEAVDAANSGDTVVVYPGTYTENVNVNRAYLAIQSQNGAELTIVEAANPDNHVFRVTADYVSISGFTVRRAGYWNAGIYIGGSDSDHVQYCTVSHNYLVDNAYGIHLEYSSNNALTNNVGSNNHHVIYLSHSPNNVVDNNITLNNYGGIVVWASSDSNTVANNTVSSNKDFGIWVIASSNTVLTRNSMSGNKYNFGVSGTEPSHFTHSIDTSNTVNGKSIQYLVDKQDMVIDPNWDVGYLGIVNCTNIEVKALTLSNNKQGVLLAYSDNCRIENIKASYNDYGIHLVSSSDNTLAGNHASNNQNIGIYLSRCSDNTLTGNTIESNFWGIYSGFSYSSMIYLNNFAANSHANVGFQNSTGRWHSSEEMAYAYNGRIYTSYLGNYWSDYAGSDADGDGIGDTPYIINGDSDTYPLMEPLETYVKRWIYGIPVDFRFNSNLSEGANVPEVRYLQIILNTDPDTQVAASGGGSPGNETTYFGPLTEDAVRRFQEKHALPETGFVCETTRDKLNERLDETFSAQHKAQFDLLDEEQRKSTIWEHIAEFKNDYLPEDFPQELILAVAAQESGEYAHWNNEHVSDDWGRGIMQITTDFTTDGPYGFVGKGGVDSDSEDCLKASDRENLKVYSSRYYSNTVRGFEANIKDGLYALWFKYTGVDQDNIEPPEGYTTEEIVWMSTVQRYNGFRTEPSYYIWNVGDKLVRLADGEYGHFDGFDTGYARELGETFKSAYNEGITLHSPAQLIVYDSEGNAAGPMDEVIRVEIPNSVYDSGTKTVLILCPSGDHHYKVTGMAEGTYGLSASFFDGGEYISFTATGIPTALGTVHQYDIDWEALAQGEDGVTVHVDSDGDGEFERTITGGSELTGEDFILKIEVVVTIDPETLNLQARGNWITAYIELPDKYPVVGVNTSTVRLIYSGNELYADWGDVEDDVFMAKFDWAQAVGWFDGLHDIEVELTVAGEVDGIEFEGRTTIRVIDPPRPRRGR